MDFKQAFDTAYDLEKERAQKEGKGFAVNSSTAKTLAFMWNMIAIAENKLDNLCYIGPNNEICEVPLKEGKGKSSKPVTGKKTADKSIEGQDDSAKTESPED